MNKHITTAAVTAGAIAAGIAGYPHTQPKQQPGAAAVLAPAVDGLSATTCTAAPYFAPPASALGSPTAAAVREIAAAKTQILVQCYSFTSKDIAQALADAHHRGVDVQVVADKSDPTGKGDLVGQLQAEGIPVLTDRAHAIAHNKVMVIDSSVVITGSFNFTEAAERANAENLIVLHSPALAKRYAENWKVHQGHSKRLGP